MECQTLGCGGSKTEKLTCEMTVLFDDHFEGLAIAGKSRGMQGK